MTEQLKPNRLESLDMLRGFDLFMLVCFQPIFGTLTYMHNDIPFFYFMNMQMDHVIWEGFRAWDLVMPLFLFMAGAAMPFSFEKYKAEPNKAAIYKRIFKRVIILFILGAIVQGNLLRLEFHTLRLFSNTLQAIAAGYLIAAVLQLHFSNKKQYIITAILLLVFWAGLTFGGDFTPRGNLAEKIDRAVLGRFRDYVFYDESGNWHFEDSYTYTWIFSSLVFGVTVMLGVFAGQIMKDPTDKIKNTKKLFIWAAALLLAGGLLSFQTPIIKHIWSASMTLWSGGLCFLLMAIFYYAIDVKGKLKWMTFLKYYGMNSIVAYCLGEAMNFRSVAQSILFGLEKYTPDFYPQILTVANFVILFLILRYMYRAKIFVKI
jgi:predicted acyltransferase